MTRTSAKSRLSSLPASTLLRRDYFGATRLSMLCLLATFGVLAIGGCNFQVERFFPGRVGDGVARLSIRNVASLVSMINADERCGFSSPEVKNGFTTEGEIGSYGRLTYTVTDCVLNFGDELRANNTNCNEIETSASGSVVVSAIRVVEGRITGAEDVPVIPESSEAAYMDFDVSFTNFNVRRSDSDTGITFKEGDATFTLRPHLSRSAENGTCSIPGANVTLEDIIFTDLLVEVDSGDGVFEAEIPTANLSAQIGRFGNKENWLGGQITAWDTVVDVPVEGEFQGLNPDYDRDAYFASYSCTPDLLVPVDYTCPDLTPRFAQGVAQLTIATYANVMRLLEADETCGFSSPAVLENPELDGQIGEAGGQARYLVNEPCAIEVPANFITSVDCNENISFAEGRLWVTGTKVVSGIRTGDSAFPIVPTSNAPALISVSAEFENFKTFNSAGVNKLFLSDGRISGTARPRTAIDTLTGACSILTPVVTFENIILENANGQLTSRGRTFDIAIAQTALTAQNGKLGEIENQLTGAMNLNGKQFNIPIEGEPVLNPSYDAEMFASNWACLENMDIPTNAADCSFMQVLGEGTARLIIAATGAIASKVNSDDSCGFEAYTTLLFPYLVEGEPGELGLMSWNVEQCSVGSEGIVQHDQNCSGGRTMTGGWANVTATRFVSGERTTMIGLINAIEPRDREAVQIELTNVVLEEFSVEPWAPGAAAPKGTLTLHSGTLSGTVTPILGEMASEPGRFEIATPIAVLTDIRLDDAVATLVSDGKTFTLNLDDVVLNATNGTWGGAANSISGFLRVNGELVTLDAQPLDETFDQAAFDATYACTEDLLETVPAG